MDDWKKAISGTVGAGAAVSAAITGHIVLIVVMAVAAGLGFCWIIGNRDRSINFTIATRGRLPGGITESGWIQKHTVEANAADLRMAGPRPRRWQRWRSRRRSRGHAEARDRPVPVRRSD